EARQTFSKAVDLDPNFGLAYAGMAIASRNLSQNQEAENYIREAVKHIDRMSERERYRTRGLFYFLTQDYPKCVEEYGSLIARYSSDVSAHQNLGVCSSSLRNLPKAIEESRKATEILPKRPPYWSNLALYESLGGDPKIGEQAARTALQIDSSYQKAY